VDPQGGKEGADHPVVIADSNDGKNSRLGLVETDSNGEEGGWI